MPKPTKGPRLGGGPAHERLMLANLAAQLFTHKSITTTETKAKRMRPLAERLITFAKRGDLHARRRVLGVISDKGVVHELFDQIAPQLAEREGGYTRITKVGYRKGDNAPLAVIELVLEPVTKRAKAPKSAVKADKPAAPADAGVVEETGADESAAEAPEAQADDVTTETQATDVPATKTAEPENAASAQAAADKAQEINTANPPIGQKSSSKQFDN